MAMRLMGEQFVTGETIAEALDRPRALEEKGFRYSYDMLGEAALTEEDAKRYLAAPTSRRSTPSARPPTAAASMKARASRSSCPRCTRATAARSTTA